MTNNTQAQAPDEPPGRPPGEGWRYLHNPPTFVHCWVKGSSSVVWEVDGVWYPVGYGPDGIVKESEGEGA